MFEFIPKCCRFPPPKDKPDSTIAMPSPPATNSCNLFVLAALQSSPSVAGPAPTINKSTVTYFREEEAPPKLAIMLYQNL